MIQNDSVSIFMRDNKNIKSEKDEVIKFNIHLKRLINIKIKLLSLFNFNFTKYILEFQKDFYIGFYLGL